MKNLNVGLVKGRHEIPAVSEYIFESINDVLDFEALEQGAAEFFKDNKDSHVTVYVTGLTAATIAVIKASKVMTEGSLSFAHYNRDTETYLVQDGFTIHPTEPGYYCSGASVLE